MKYPWARLGNESQIISIASRIFVGVVLAGAPQFSYSQTDAAVSLDASGNLVLSATLEYTEFITQELFGEFGPWNLSNLGYSADHQWMYFDIRNSQYNNGYSVDDPTGLVSIFNANPDSSILLNNVAFLQNLFYMGEYTFGDSDYPYIVPVNIPDIEIGANRTYFGGKNASAFGESRNGKLSMSVTLPFDPPLSGAYSPLDYYLKDEAGNYISA